MICSSHGASSSFPEITVDLSTEYLHEEAFTEDFTEPWMESSTFLGNFSIAMHDTVKLFDLGAI